MAFKLGNFNIDEIIYGVAENFDGEILYSLDQLSSASIEVTSESTDVTDKNGNVVRTIYKSKQGTFSATNAFLHPQIMNAASGSAIVDASSTAPVDMPKVVVYAAEAVPTAKTLADIKASTVPEVIGIFGAGANSKRLTSITTGTPSFDTATNTGTFLWDSAQGKITLPASGDNKPLNYLVKFDRSVESGMKLSNSVNSFPATVALTLYCSYVDPCDDDLRACYVVLPSFQASPETTISLSADEQEMDFNGSIQVDYCATDPVLYYIYLPDEDAVKTGV